MYALMKQDFTARLKRLADEGVRRVVLFGAGETGELAIAAAADAGMQIAGIVDNDAAKQGRLIGSVTVGAPATIETLRPDAVVITSYGHGDEIEAQVRPMEAKGIRIVRV